MSIRAYYREDLALAQLETALRLYFEGTDYASVITLAGAAEEVFGRQLKATGRENSLESIKAAVKAIQEKVFGEAHDPKAIADRANSARNSLKHFADDDTEIVKFDLKIEACDMLHRAIDNYWMLQETLSPAMERFQRDLHALQPTKRG